MNPDGHPLTDDLARGFTRDEVALSRYAGVQTDARESQGMTLRLLPEKSRVLDVGCGTGDFARAMRDARGCDVVVVEPNTERASVAAGDDGLKVIAGFLTPEIVAAEAPYDAVTFMDVLEHAPDPVALLATAAAGLRPGGSVFISVPNVAHWTVRLKLLAGRFDYQPTGIMDATHLRWFTRRTIVEVARAAGLRVEHQDVSRGFTLKVYHERRPWRWLSPAWRRRLVDVLCRLWPGLFGCQHFLMAIKD